LEIRGLEGRGTEFYLPSPRNLPINLGQDEGRKNMGEEWRKGEIPKFRGGGGAKGRGRYSLILLKPELK